MLPIRTPRSLNPTRTNHRRADRWLAVLAGLIGAALFLVLCYPLLRGNIYQGSDLAAYHLPARSFYSHCLKNGLSFLWWPDQFCGYYLHGEGQVGMYHPLHWVLYRFLPLDWAFNLEFASGYLLAYGGMVALLRRWRLPWFAAIFGANLFTFSGFTLLHFIHLQAIAVIAQLPWHVLALDMLMKSRDANRIRRASLAIALLFASQLLLGYPQYVLFTLMGMALYTAAHLRQPGPVPRVAWLATGLALGLMLGAIQLLPTFDLVSSVQRQQAEDFWRGGSLPPLNLLQWAGPYFFENRVAYGVPEWEYGLYPGMMPVVLSLLLLLQWRRLDRWRTLAGLFAFQTVLMLVLALGEHGGLYGLLAKLPVLGSFRCAARHIVLIHFALAVLGALALARMRPPDPAPTPPPPHRALLLAASAIGLLALGAALAARHWGGPEVRGALADAWPVLLLGPALLVTAALLAGNAARWPRLGPALIMVFAAIDIGVYAFPQVQGHRPQSTGLDGLVAVLQEELPDDPTFVPHDTAFRAHGNWRVARLAPLGLPNYLGYVGLPPSWVLDPNADTTKRVAGVRWEKRPLSARDWTIHEDALPLVRLVTRTQVSTYPRDDIERIDVTAVALTETPVDLPAGTPGTVSWLSNDPGNVSLQVEAQTEQLLVFAQRFHAGWRATVDGESVALQRVNGDFMGCTVPAGSHTVNFQFAPSSHRYGAWMTLTGLVLAVGWAAATILPRRALPDR